MTIPAFAPGCYGSALAFNPEEDLCARCPFAAGCEPLHYQTKQALCERLGVPYMPPKHAAGPITPAIRNLMRALANPARDLLRKMSEGLNPFASNERVPQMVCHLLLRAGKPLSVGAISHAIHRTTGTDEGKIQKQTDALCIAMAEMGALRRVGTSFELNKW